MKLNSHVDSAEFTGSLAQIQEGLQKLNINEEVGGWVLLLFGVGCGHRIPGSDKGGAAETQVMEAVCRCVHYTLQLQ